LAGSDKSKKGNNIAAWVREFTPDLLSWATVKVTNPELAKDLVQDTFLAAYERLSSFKGDSQPRTWLFSILNFKIIDHYRFKTKQSKSIGSQSLSDFFNADGEWLQEKKPGHWDLDESHLLDNEAFNQILKLCLDALPESWSLSIKLKYLMNKNGDEICQELGISPTNFWQLTHRAKLQLRDCLQINWFQEQ
jgi:RNA polymerase sigma-70 factor (TIGR02943 family)